MYNKLESANMQITNCFVFSCKRRQQFYRKQFQSSIYQRTFDRVWVIARSKFGSSEGSLGILKSHAKRPPATPPSGGYICLCGV